MAENWIFIYTIKPNLKVSSIVCRVVSAIALEDVSEELSRLYQAADMLVKGGPQACEEAFEVTIRGNKMTVASMPIEERTFYFIVSEGEENYIALRSSIFPEMEIRLPMPTYLRVGKTALGSEDLC